jgi:cobalt-zinc-cadmium efflux system outer membrane protein
VKLLSLLAALAFAATCQAQGPRRLTLDEALAMADRYNPRLKAASASVDAASAAIKTAGAWNNPTLSFGTLGRQQAIMNTTVPGMLNGFSVNQLVELPKLRGSRIQAAEIARQSTEYTVRETRLEVLGAVKQAYLEVLRRRTERDLAKENLTLLEDLRRRIQAQVSAGEAARLELVRADAEVASARIQVQSAELRRTIALSNLYGAVGTPLGQVELVPLPDRPRILPTLEELRTEAVNRHPAILYAESETRRTQAVLAYERAQRIPQPTLWADVFQQPDAAQYRFGVSLNLPLWNKREGPIAEAQAQQRQTNALAQQKRLEVSAAVEASYNLYQVASQQVEIFEAGTMRSAESAVQAAEAAFKFGERGIVEVLDAQRVLRAARMDYVNAMYDRQQALLQLEQLSGIDLNGGKP